MLRVDIHFHTFDICKILSRFTYIHLCYNHLLKLKWFSCIILGKVYLWSHGRQCGWWGCLKVRQEYYWGLRSVRARYIATGRRAGSRGEHRGDTRSYARRVAAFTRVSETDGAVTLRDARWRGHVTCQPRDWSSSGIHTTSCMSTMFELYCIHIYIFIALYCAVLVFRYFEFSIRGRILCCLTWVW